MISAVPYTDGWVGSGKETTVVPDTNFPFEQNPARADKFTRDHVREYLHSPLGYVTRAGRRTAWTNALTYSELLANSAWTKTNASATDGVETAPDGQEDAMGKILETAGSGEHSIAQAATATAVPWEFTVFVKGGLTRRWLRLAFVDSAAATHSAFFEFVSGSVGAVSANATAKIVPLGDDYFRCVLQVTPAAGAGTFKVNLSTNGSTISYTGSTSAGAYLWGMQASAGADSPYISTTGAARSISAPDRDPVDPFAYLIDEQRAPFHSAEIKVRRMFSRIPLEQTVPDSQWVKKPDLPGTFPQVSGNALIVKPDPNIPQWVFYTQVAVSDSGPADPNHPSGGTWTITVGANTTAPIAYNASAATVEAALNAIASVTDRGSFSVTGAWNSGGFRLRLNQYAAGTLGVGSLGASGGGFAGFGTTCTVLNANGDTVMHFTIATQPGGTINSGTFTVSIFGQTTSALAYNITTADLQTAIRALSRVGTDAVVSIPTTGGWGSLPLRSDGSRIEFFVAIVPYAVSGTGTSLTPAGSGVTVTEDAASTASNYFYFAILSGTTIGQRTLASTGAHGITESDGIVITQGSNYRTLAPGSYTVPTANTIQLTSASGTAYSDTTTITVVGKQTGQVYTAEAKLTRVKRITTHYLVGVSVGDDGTTIEDIDDVPLPTYQGDPASMLNAIFEGSTAINLEVGELDPYRDGPIVQRTRTVINAATL